MEQAQADLALGPRNQNIQTHVSVLLGGTVVDTRRVDELRIIIRFIFKTNPLLSVRFRGDFL